MRKPDQGSAAAEGARRATGDAAGARPWRPIVSGAEARGGAASVARGGSRVGVAGGGDHRGAGLAVARPVSGRGPGQPEEPGAGCPERRRSSAAGQDRRAADGERAPVREGGPAGGGRPFGPAEVEAMRGAHSISTRRAYGLQRICRVWALRSLQRLRAAAGDNVPGAVSAPRAGRRGPGRRPGRPHSPGARSVALSWRRVPEGLDEAPGRGNPHFAGTGAPVDARA